MITVIVRNDVSRMKSKEITKKKNDLLKSERNIKMVLKFNTKASGRLQLNMLHM